MAVWPTGNIEDDEIVSMEEARFVVYIFNDDTYGTLPWACYHYNISLRACVYCRLS